GVADAVGPDQVHKVAADLLGALTIGGQRLGQSLHSVRGHRGPDPALAHAVNMIDGSVEDVVGEVAECCPVRGVEALFGLARQPGGAGHARTLTGFCQYSLPSPFSAAEG